MWLWTKMDTVCESYTNFFENWQSKHSLYTSPYFSMRTSFWIIVTFLKCGYGINTDTVCERYANFFENGQSKHSHESKCLFFHVNFISNHRELSKMWLWHQNGHPIQKLRQFFLKTNNLNVPRMKVLILPCNPCSKSSRALQNVVMWSKQTPYVWFWIVASFPKCGYGHKMNTVYESYANFFENWQSLLSVYVSAYSSQGT